MLTTENKPWVQIRQCLVKYQKTRGFEVIVDEKLSFFNHMTAKKNKKANSVMGVIL